MASVTTSWWQVYDFSHTKDSFFGQSKVLGPFTLALVLITNCALTVLVTWRITSVSRTTCRDIRTSTRVALGIFVESAAVLPIYQVVALYYNIRGEDYEAMVTNSICQRECTLL